MPSPAQEFAALQKLPPAEAVAYMQQRNKVTETYSWRDLWQDEHTVQFTVSRLLRADLLQSFQDQIAKSVQGDLSRRDFMRDSKKMLQDAGWWGTKEVINPDTGEIVQTTFDPARLKLIFDTNTRMASAAGQWERIQRSKRAFPYVRYITMGDDKVRPAHRAWNGVTLPVDHAFWNTHNPPNGWRCRCRLTSVSQKEYDAGLTPTGGPMKKTPPDVLMRDWLDKTTGNIRQIPVGIDPGFGYNPGAAGVREREQAQVVRDKLAGINPPLASAARAAGLAAPKIAKAVESQPTWKTLGLPDLRDMGPAMEAPALLPGATSPELALTTLRSALGIEAGGSILVQTPIERVRLLDASLPHVVEKGNDGRERFANFVLPTLREPTEVWSTRYDDATVRNRYIKLFAGSKYDLLVIVRVEPDGSIFWNMMQRERRKMNELRMGERLYGGT